MFIYDFKTKVQILEGWSDDKKYCVTTENDKKYLLRISKIEQKERKSVEFEFMKRIEALGVPMCNPITFGTCDEGVYCLQSWIEGKNFEEVIIMLTDKDQYDYGVQAGQILKKIHTIKIPDTHEKWEIQFNRKIERKIQMYKECPIKYENGQFFIDYINKNRYLLNSRPQCYQHGDYHVGNMMIDNYGNLQIIDFDRADFGDPWQEFDRIVWSAQKSPLFASGMVNGYFDENVPMDFWKLLALYISNNTISSISWAMQFGKNEINNMINQAKEVLQWYDNMQNPVPTWYKGCIL